KLPRTGHTQYAAALEEREKSQLIFQTDNLVLLSSRWLLRAVSSDFPHANLVFAGGRCGPFNSTKPRALETLILNDALAKYQSSPPRRSTSPRPAPVLQCR